MCSSTEIISEGRKPREEQVATRTRNGRHRDSTRWPDPGKPLGAVLYAVVAGLIVWLLVDILPHVHVSITWH
jgi:hypothetical protein